MKKVLTIAGSDSSGGAGIQADLKTVTMHGVYGMSVITALTAQNTTGVAGVMPVTPEFIQLQMASVFSDICPDAIKIGMLAQKDIIEAIAEFFERERTSMQNIPVVLDPVMVTTSGCSLMEQSASRAMMEQLFPWATLITPNIPEAEALTGATITNFSDMEREAKALEQRFGCSVLIKGGHCREGASDVLCTKGQTHWFNGEILSNPNKHGTGCTLSSAIASNLALGRDLVESCARAKQYVERSIGANLNLGAGSGPLNHMAAGRWEID